jgi:hypothetical protein
VLCLLLLKLGNAVSDDIPVLILQYQAYKLSIHPHLQLQFVGYNYWGKHLLESDYKTLGQNDIAAKSQTPKLMHDRTCTINSNNLAPRYVHMVLMVMCIWF